MNDHPDDERQHDGITQIICEQPKKKPPAPPIKLLNVLWNACVKTATVYPQALQ